MPTITQLEYLLAVQKTKHFGKAADLCNVSQPSLSAQIQKVEDELEIVIFDRSKKPILVTELGEKILEVAKSVIHEHAKLESIKAHSGEVAGKFHLGVIPTLSPYVIPLFVHSFTEEFPEVELQITEMKTEDIIQSLNEDGIDGGLLVTPLKEPSLIERPIFQEPFWAFLSEDHPLVKRKTLSEKDLSGDDLWILDEGHCFRDQVLHFCRLQKKRLKHGNVNFSSGSLETLIQLVRKSSGYTLLPELALSNLSTREKNTQLKSFSGPKPTREVSLVHARSFYKDAILSALVDSIGANLPEQIHSYRRSKTKVVPIK